MTNELDVLSVVAGLTALMWVPYILDAMVVRGVWPTLDNPRDDAPPLHPWAARAKRAHANAVENLVVFAALAVAVVVADKTDATTALAATIYLWARVTHWVVYVAGIAVVRTLAFVAGCAAQLMLAAALLG